MATYDSIHTGNQVDQATDKVLANKDKGSATTPIYLNANGEAVEVTKATQVIESDAKLIESGVVCSELGAKYNKSDIATDDQLGESTVFIPSQGAVKTYADNAFAPKQKTLVAGDGINISGATVSLGNTSTFMAENEIDYKREHFVEGLVSGSNVSTLEKMNRSNHSTFDRNKFATIGSPIVTSDGIASGFSSDSYLTIPSQNLTYQNNWEVVSPEFEVGATNLGQAILVIGDNNSRLIIQAKNDGRFLITTQIPLSVGNILRVDTVAYSANTKYQVKVTHTSAGVYTAYLKTGNGDFAQIGSPVTNTTAQFNTTGLPCRIGFSTDNTGAVTNGSIDLKQFSITVDGVPVFSGNKTGIDVIKPNNYTTTTNPPTITEEGIASGFTQSKYIDNSVAIDCSQDLDISFKYIQLNELQVRFQSIWSIYKSGWTDDRFYMVVSNSYPTTFYLMYPDGDNHHASKSYSNFLPSEVGAECVIRMVKTNTDIKLYRDNVLIDIISINNYYFNFTSSKVLIGNCEKDVHYKFFKNKIDLNTFKIYSNNTLVYQPMLRIPYTLAKDGKKIVDYHYKDRVEDEYTQAGYTPYYTLLETAKTNFLKRGTVTISDDYVASGFGSGNYIATSMQVVAEKAPFVIQIGFITGSNLNGYQDLIDTYGFLDNGFVFRVHDGSFMLTSTSGSSVSSYSVNTQTKYIAKVVFDGTNKLSAFISSDGGRSFSRLVNDQTITPFNGTRTPCLGVRNGTSNAFSGSIDLKDFKIYSSGKLAYEAVALPQYTMQTVKPSELVDSKVDGANIYRQYANQTTEQYGTCTSGTAVTFEKPFMDTNYALSVPYSTKTKTGFAPTQTGSWKAKGKVSI